MTTATIATVRQQASELRDFLMTNIAHRMHPEAHVMGAWLSILLTSCTPDALELLETEYDSICEIMGIPKRDSHE